MYMNTKKDKYKKSIKKNTKYFTWIIMYDNIKLQNRYIGGYLWLRKKRA